MTWWSEHSAAPRFVLAKLAIRCRFVDRFVGSKVPSPVSGQRLSSSRRLPSLARVPVSPVPCVHRSYEGATTSRSRIPGRLSVSLPGSARSSTLRARRGAPGMVRRSPSGPGAFAQPPPICPAHSAPGRDRDLTGSQATRPMPLPRSKTPAGPTILTKSLPVVQQHRLRRIGGLRALNFIHGGLRSICRRQTRPRIQPPAAKRSAPKPLV